MRRTIASCLPSLGDFGFFDVVDQGEVRRTVVAHQAPDVEALLAPTQWAKQDCSELNLCALSSGEAGLHEDTDDSWYQHIAASDGHLALLRQLAFRSMITVPIRCHGEVVGALTLFMGRSGRRHSAVHLESARRVCALAAELLQHKIHA